MGLCIIRLGLNGYGPGEYTGEAPWLTSVAPCNLPVNKARHPHNESNEYLRAPSRRSNSTAFRVDGMGRAHQIEGMAQTDLAAIEASAVRLLSREEAEREDRLYWHSKTPAERLAAAEQLRQVAYGYDAATARIQAVVVRTFCKEG